MAVLTVDQILAADDVKVEKVPVPEWGKDAEVCVRGMSGKQLDLFEQTQENPNIRGRLIAWCLCDEKGARLDPTPDQIARLGDKSGKALDRVCKKALRLSGLAGESLEELEKN